MTQLERRLARLEVAQGNATGLIECGMSEEGKELLRQILIGLHTPEEIERIVNTKVLMPRRGLSPAAREQLEEALHALSSKRTPPVTGRKSEVSGPKRIATHTFFHGAGDE